MRGKGNNRLSGSGRSLGCARGEFMYIILYLYLLSKSLGQVGLATISMSCHARVALLPLAGGRWRRPLHPLLVALGRGLWALAALARAAAVARALAAALAAAAAAAGWASGGAAAALARAAHGGRRLHCGGGAATAGNCGRRRRGLAARRASRWRATRRRAGARRRATGVTAR